MRVLIDECVDPRVKTLLADHEPATVHDKGWSSFEDGEFLAFAQTEFDVLLTIDRGIEFQHNLPKLRIGIVVANVAKNQLVHYRRIEPELLSAIARIRPGELIHVGAPLIRLN